ncbi:hypothetical protein [Vitiosangium sp. GDMCC 1.1324]|uniref:hypothetical protein n=1 Tax=Vitiosangium sp. (strain GDMCC 1.1324) TaxID=2138576 RepID=UPI0011B7D6D7|nr:hypothetical protein [Vitiosangium sp. GDMCC 1.1324]
MRYFKRPWDESRGDEYDHWGTSVWYLEVDAEGGVSRQLTVFENGSVLKYDEARPEDRYGGLAHTTLDLEEDGFLPFEIDRAEFESAWQRKRTIVP